MKIVLYELSFECLNMEKEGKPVLVKIKGGDQPKGP